MHSAFSRSQRPTVNTII